MSKSNRILWAVAIVLIDILFFAIPVGSIFLAYVLIARPKWLPELTEAIYKE